MTAVAGQGQQQLLEVLGQALDMRAAESLAGVVELQAQCLAYSQQHGQWIVGLFQAVHCAKTQPRRCALLQRLGHRVVLEHQDTVEQRFSTQPRPALDLKQWRVFMLTQANVLLLELL